MDQIVPYVELGIKLLAIGIGAIGFFYALKGQIDRLSNDIQHIKDNQKSLQEAFAQLGSILTKVAVQDTRLNMIEKKLDELSHGQGFVKVIN